MKKKQQKNNKNKIPSKFWSKLRRRVSFKSRFPSFELILRASRDAEHLLVTDSVELKAEGAAVVRKVTESGAGDAEPGDGRGVGLALEVEEGLLLEHEPALLPVLHDVSPLGQKALHFGIAPLGRRELARNRGWGLTAKGRRS